MYSARNTEHKKNKPPSNGKIAEVQGADDWTARESATFRSHCGFCATGGGALTYSLVIHQLTGKLETLAFCEDLTNITSGSGIIHQSNRCQGRHSDRLCPQRRGRVFNKAGELRFEVGTQSTMLYADGDRDGVADFVIRC